MDAAVDARGKRTPCGAYPASLCLFYHYSEWALKSGQFRTTILVHRHSENHNIHFYYQNEDFF